MSASTAGYVFLYAVRPLVCVAGLLWAGLKRARLCCQAARGCCSHHWECCPHHWEKALTPHAVCCALTVNPHTHVQVHYYIYKTRMSGLFQMSFYFGYTAMTCFGENLGRGKQGHVCSYACQFCSYDLLGEALEGG